MALPSIDPVYAFFERLQKAKNRPLNEKLGKLISPRDYTTIVNYFLNIQDPTIIDRLYDLRPGEALRLDKKTFNLPRTLNILCSSNGELKLIVETKSKLADNTKQKLPKAAGTFKSGKPAWRIDSEQEIEYFNLVAKLASDHALQEMKNEAALSQYFGSDKIDVLELGRKFSKNHHGKHQTQISAYSLRAKGDLRSVLTKEQKALSEEQKNNMMLNLLEGLQILEARQIVHQDLKPENILAYGNLQEGYRLKISDLGLASQAGNPYTSAAATASYQSPEISFYHAKPGAPHHQYFNSGYAKNSLGHAYFTRDRERFNVHNVGRPHQANDAWAMGVVLCEIRYGFKPTTPQQIANIKDPLIQGLLHPDRQKRLNAHQALAVLQEQIRITRLAQPIAPIPRPRVTMPPPVAARKNIPLAVAVPPVPAARKAVPPPVPPRKDIPPTAAPALHRPRVNLHEQARRKAQAEAQQKAQKKEAIDNVAVIHVLNTLSKEIKFEYPEKNKGKNASTGKWIIRQMQGENRVRTKQIENITQKLLNIKEDKKLTAEQKAEKAYQALSDLQAEIKKEGNFFPSALNQLCEEKKERLMTLYPQLNTMPLHQQKDNRPPPP